MGLKARIQWTEGVLYESGGLRYRSRFDTSPTPSGIWSTADGTGLGQANDVYEAVFTITAGSTLSIDLTGAGGEKNVANVALAFTKVKGVELILTTVPAAGVSLLLGPQAVTNAAQLWFNGVAAADRVEVRDRFAQLDKAVGWALVGAAVKLPVKNPGAASVSGWIRVIGVR